MQTTNNIKDFMEGERLAARAEAFILNAPRTDPPIAVIKTSWRRVKRPSIKTIIKILLAS